MGDVLDQINRSVATARVSVTVTSAYTMTSADRVVRVDCTSGAVTITLPPALSVVGEVLRILKTDTSGNAVTVAVTSPDTIGPSAVTSVSLTSAGSVTTLRAARNGDTVMWDDVIGPATSSAASELPATWSQPDSDQTVPANATTIVTGDPLVIASGFAVILASGALLILDPRDGREQINMTNSEPSANVDLLGGYSASVRGLPLILDSGIVYALQPNSFLELAA